MEMRESMQLEQLRRKNAALRHERKRSIQRLEQESRRNVMEPKNTKLMTLKEAADKIGCKYDTVRHWVMNGRLTAQKIGRSVMVNEKDLVKAVSMKKESKRGRPWKCVKI